MGEAPDTLIAGGRKARSFSMVARTNDGGAEATDERLRERRKKHRRERAAEERRTTSLLKDLHERREAAIASADGA